MLDTNCWEMLGPNGAMQEMHMHMSKFGSTCRRQVTGYSLQVTGELTITIEQQSKVRSTGPSLISG